ELLGIELTGGEVVEEEEWLGPAAEDVVDAVVDQVDAHPAVASGGDGDLDLGAHPVGAGHQHRVAATSRGEGEQPAEGAEAARHHRRSTPLSTHRWRRQSCPRSHQEKIATLRAAREPRGGDARTGFAPYPWVRRDLPGSPASRSARVGVSPPHVMNIIVEPEQ